MQSMLAPSLWTKYMPNPSLQRYGRVSLCLNPTCSYSFGSVTILFSFILVWSFRLPFLTLIVFPQGLNCNLVVEMANNIKALHNETELLLAGKMALVRDKY